MALVLFLRQRYDVREDRPAEKTSVLSDIADGLRWLKNAPAIWLLAINNAIMNLTFMAGFSVLVLLARERLGLTGTGFGVLLAVSAGGGIAGASVVARVRARLSLSALLRAGMLVEASGLIVLGLVRDPFLAGASMLVASFVSTLWGVAVISYRQAMVPSHLLLGGLVAAIIGVGQTFLAAGLVDLVLAAVMGRYLTAANLSETEPNTDSATADPAEMLEGD